MKKLKKYENYVNIDQNFEKEIDKILQTLIQQKFLISMLRDTINHVVEKVEKVLPKDLDNFTESLRYYEDDVHICFEKIRENMMDGYPNLKDIIEDIEADFSEIEEYLKVKFPQK